MRKTRLRVENRSSLYSIDLILIKSLLALRASLENRIKIRLKSNPNNQRCLRGEHIFDVMITFCIAKGTRFAHSLLAQSASLFSFYENLE
jgi:hypothetical protein